MSLPSRTGHTWWRDRCLRAWLLLLLGLGALARGEAPGQESGNTTRAPYYRKQWAIVIGVNDYYTDINLPPLKASLIDASSVQQLLVEDFGYDPSRVHYLRNASRTQIKDALVKWLRQQDVRPEDSVLFYFAGHGTMTKADVQGYLAGVDARASAVACTWVSIQWIVEQLDKLAARHKAIILDSCFSGALFSRVPPDSVPTRDALTSPSPRSRGRNSASMDSYHYYLMQPTFVGMSAGRLDVVADGGSGDGHSYFTSALLEVLRNRADSAREDQAFTFRQVAAQVETAVANRFGSEQIPNWGTVRPVGDGDFIFRPVRPRPTPTQRREMAIRRARYAAEMLSVQEALDAPRSGAASDAQELLDNHLPSPTAPDLRGFEWWYLWHQVHPESAILFPAGPASEHESEGTTWRITEMATHPTLGLVAVAVESPASESGQVIVYRVANDRFIEQFRIPGKRVALAFTPDGRTLVIGQVKQGVTLQLVSVAEPGPHRTIELDEYPVSEPSFSRDGQRFAANLEDSVGIWSTSTGRMIFEHRWQTRETGVALAPGGDVVAFSGPDNVVRVCRVGSGACSALGRHNDAVHGLLFMPDGAGLVSYSRDRTIRIWRLAERTSLKLKVSETPSQVVLEPGGDGLYVRLDSGAVLYWQRGQREFTPCLARVRMPVAMGALGERRLVLAGEDGSLSVLGRGARAMCPGFSTGAQVASAFSPDATRLVMAPFSRKELQVWNTETGTRLLTVPLPALRHVRAVAFSGDGKWIAVGGEQVEGSAGWVGLLDSETGQQRAGVGGLESSVGHLAFMGDEALVVAGEAFNKAETKVALNVVDFKQQVHHLKEWRRPVSALASSLDGKRIVIGDILGSLYIYHDLDSLVRDPFNAHDTRVGVAVLSDDGQMVVSSSWEGPPQVEDLEGGGARTPLVGNMATIRSLAISPDNQTVAVGSEDGRVYFWKPSGERVGMGHDLDFSIKAMRFSPDGRRLAICGSNGRVRVLRAANDEEVLRFYREAHARAQDMRSRRLLVQAYWARYLSLSRNREVSQEELSGVLKEAEDVLLRGREEESLSAEEARWLKKFRELQAGPKRPYPYGP